MNRWDVYEWLKNSYMYSGRIPKIQEIRIRFTGQTSEEQISEGITMFQQTLILSPTVKGT